MANKTEKLREPLFHIAKRGAMPWWQSVLIRGGTILIGFLVSGLLAWAFVGVDPFTFIGKLFDGIFSSERRTWIFLRNTAVLLGIAVALAPAFKMKFWNTGAEGQVLMGGLACAIVMHYVGGNKIPDEIVYILMVVAGVVAGALWAVIPAIFKAFWNTNETLFTLMMNYIAIQLIAFFTDLWVKDGSGVMKNKTHLHGVMFPEWGNAYLMTIIVVVLLTVGMWAYLRFTKHGYELSVVGESENTAKYIGINVKKVIIRTIALSGAVCGLIGVLLVGSINGTIAQSTAGGQGFTGIIVAWLGKFNPIFMIMTAALVIFLDRGIGNLNLSNNAFAAIITGIIIFFIIGCEFFINYQIKFKHKKEKKADFMDPPAGEDKAEADEQPLENAEAEVNE